MPPPSTSRYRILNRLGEGGMGVVYRAEDTVLGRHVALKFLSRDQAADQEAKERFVAEARAASVLRHPGICTIYDVGETDDGEIFISMGLYEGETLRQRLDRGALPLAEVLGIGRKIAAALVAAHKADVIHRDIKPENVMLTSDGDVVVLDFGIAKLAGAVRRTRTGFAMGTVGYMAPEQARGETPDRRVDLFSLGVILSEMLTGRHPFAAPHPAAVLYRVANEDPEPLGSIPGIPSEVIALVGQLLAKDPESRTRSAEEAIKAIDTIAGSEAKAARSPGQNSGRLPVAAGSHAETRFLERNSEQKDPIRSLAVLPFLNQGEDPDVDYLSDGITDSLIDTLSRIRRLKVMARSTVFRYDPGKAEPVAVGRDLGVQAVLTGRLVLRGDTLTIRAELVDTRDGTSLWGDRFRRPVNDLMDIEETISRQIIQGLLVRLDPDEESQLSDRRTVQPEAYQEYLKGRRVWNLFKTADGMRSAIGFFEEAVRLDPLFALAYAGLADSYSILGNIKALPPQEAFPKARSYATQGLAINENLGELHSSIAFIHRHWEWDWDAADAAYRKAIALSPGYATAYRFHGGLLVGLGRYEEGISQVGKALDLDPLSLIIRTALGDAYFYARRYDESIRMYEDCIRMDDSFLPGHSDLARVFEVTGRYDDAIREYRKAAVLAARIPPEPSSGLANVYARMGRHDEAREILAELIAMRSRSYVSPYGIASILASLHDRDRAFEWLDRAYAERDQTLVVIKVHPRLDPLRDDPRFVDLLTRMRL